MYIWRYIVKRTNLCLLTGRLLSNTQCYKKSSSPNVEARYVNQMYQEAVNIKKSVLLETSFFLCFIKWHRHPVLQATCFRKWEKPMLMQISLFCFADPPFNVQHCSSAFWIYDAVGGNLWEAGIMRLANTIEQIFLQTNLNNLFSS